MRARCDCCGLPFKDSPPIHGPYTDLVYETVCDRCWRYPCLYFPDKPLWISENRPRMLEEYAQKLGVPETGCPKEVND